ncbi:MAG: DUF748 domain-containing protein [Betaproteobacteria bacterium]
MALLARILDRRRAGRSPAPLRPSPRKSRWRGILLGCTAIFAGLIAFGFLAAPPLIKSLLTSRVSQELGRKVTVGDIRINPFLLTLEITGFAIQEPGSDQRFVAFERLLVDLETESLYRRAPVIREVLLDKPYVHVARLPGNRFNFTDLIEKFSKPKKDDSPPPAFSVNNIRIRGGALDIDDQTVSTKHKVRDLDLSVPFISNLPYQGDIFVQPAFSARINDTPLALKGKTRPFSAGRDTFVEIRLQNLDIPYYLRYAPIDPPYRVDSAKADLALDVNFASPPGGASKLSVNGTAAIHHVSIVELDGKPLIAFDRLEASTRGIDILGRKIPLQHLKLSGVRLHAHRRADGSLNLSSLALTRRVGSELKDIRTEETRSGNQPSAKESPQKEVSVDTLEIDGIVGFEDDGVQPAFRTTLSPLALSLSGFSTNPEAAPAVVRLTAATEAGETVEIKGTYAFMARTFDADLKVGKVVPARYAPYYARSILFDIVAGEANLQTHVNAPLGTPDAGIALTGLEFGLDNLRLRRRGEKKDFLAVPGLRLARSSVDLGNRRITLADLRITRPAAEIRRSKDGTVDLTKLTPPAAKAPPARPSSAAAQTPGAPWVVDLQHLLLEGGNVHFVDEVPEDPVDLRIAPLQLDIAGLSIGAPATARVTLKARINGKADATVTGTLRPDPLDARLRTRITELDILPFSPYFADRLNLTLTSADLSADGLVSLATPSKGPMAIGYEGNATIARLATLDTAGSEDLLKWESLFFDGVRLNTAPFSLAVKNIALTDFYARLQINADGTLNVQNLAGRPAGGDDRTAPARKPASAPPAPSGPPGNGSPVPASIRIDQVTLQGGTINFSDRLIKPNVNATLNEIGGRVTGLLSDATTRADVELRGKLSNQAPLEIKGKVNPLSGDLFADLKLSFRNIELPAFTPYSGRYAGYTIEKGKLSLDLDYLIEKRQIRARNNIFIDQFTFGDEVKSADATGLPVKFAVSLLKDRNGQINLDIPVSGSLDDPKFKLGRVIWQVIVNLVTKAVTAPFALLGSLMGGDSEELSYVDFAAGSSAIEPSGQGKIDQLAKALTARPALTLEVTGHVDTAKDREALRMAVFQRKLKAQRFAELSRKGQAPASIDATTVDPDQYERILGKAYKAEKFPKPRNAIGLEKDLPRTEMEKLMQTNIVIGDDDLRQLAMSRSQTVKDALTGAGQIASERVFLLEPKTLAAQARDKASASRADFAIR